MKVCFLFLTDNKPNPAFQSLSSSQRLKGSAWALFKSSSCFSISCLRNLRGNALAPADNRPQNAKYMYSLLTTDPAFPVWECEMHTVLPITGLVMNYDSTAVSLLIFISCAAYYKAFM